ncbi:uncharacterized protein LOC109118169 [Fukomys damarensis]|uniref:uncharacterized protein LOC109118169 n=1 Tax=Fukomys damarensis TaxID=885580 RepID=UPI0008FEC3C4|nr:uncharacterized protein LOC109118169 [Fukomys damarensis]
MQRCLSLGPTLPPGLLFTGAWFLPQTPSTPLTCSTSDLLPEPFLWVAQALLQPRSPCPPSEPSAAAPSSARGLSGAVGQPSEASDQGHAALSAARGAGGHWAHGGKGERRTSRWHLGLGGWDPPIPETHQQAASPEVGRSVLMGGWLSSVFVYTTVLRKAARGWIIPHTEHNGCGPSCGLQAPSGQVPWSQAQGGTWSNPLVCLPQFTAAISRYIGGVGLVFLHKNTRWALYLPLGVSEPSPKVKMETNREAALSLAPALSASLKGPEGLSLGLVTWIWEPLGPAGPPSMGPSWGTGHGFSVGRAPTASLVHGQTLLTLTTSVPQFLSL